MLNVRNAEIADLEQIMKIYRYAQDYMIESGNPTQWGHFYPDADLIKSDIDQNVCKLIYDENGIHGVFALFDGAEPTYKHIEGGNWLNEGPYLTIHRLAGDGQAHGLFSCALDYCKQALQEKYKDKWEAISPEAGKHKLLWMLGEVGEVIDIIKKNGDQKSVEDVDLRQHLVEEMADVLMYYNDVLLCYGISEQELKEAYIAKFEKNMKWW